MAMRSIVGTRANRAAPGHDVWPTFDPEILGGTPVFVGTRVPVKSLYDYLEAGDSLDEFLDSFPSVTRDQAQACVCGHGLAVASRVLIALANAAAWGEPWGRVDEFIGAPSQSLTGFILVPSGACCKSHRRTYL